MFHSVDWTVTVTVTTGPSDWDWGLELELIEILDHCIMPYDVWLNYQL